MLFHSAHMALDATDVVEIKTTQSRTRPIMAKFGSASFVDDLVISMSRERAEALVESLQKAIDELSPPLTLETKSLARKASPSDLVSNVISMSEGRIS